MYNQRILNIAKILLTSEKDVTISEIAAKMELSNRTIRNTFPLVESFIAQSNLRLIRKTGVGVSVSGRESDKLKLLSEMNTVKPERYGFSSKSRQLQIIDMLLMDSNKSITVNYLEEVLYVSRPSLYKDLEEVRKWFADREIEVVRNRKNGIIIKYGEKRMRRAIFDYILAKERYNEDNINIGDPKPTSAGSSSLAEYLMKSAPPDERCEFERKTANIMLKVEQIFEIKFIQLDLDRLIKRFFISIWRMKNGCYITMRSKTINELKSLESYKNMSAVVEEIENSFDISMTDAETCYLFGIIISSKTCRESHEFCISEHCLEINRQIALNIEEIVCEHYNIKDREMFYNDIINHLRSVANKIKYGLDFYNPLEENIQEKFPELFELAAKAAPIIKMYYDYDIPKGEICYITMLIAAAIEHSKSRLRTYLIYNYNYREINYMMEMIKNNLAQVEICSVYPAYMLSELDFKNIDLVITNHQPDYDTGKKVIVLPTLLTNDDILKIQKEVIQIFEDVNSTVIKVTK